LDKFLNIKVSQGTVTTRLRRDEILNDQCIMQSLLSLKVKEFWKSFAEVMGKNQSGCFFWTKCTTYYIWV